MSDEQKRCTGCSVAPAIKRYSRGQHKWVFHRCLECARKEVAASRKRRHERDAAWKRFLDEWKVAG